MRLHRISLENYRGVGKQDIQLSSGVTIIQGPNEVGKTSVAESLRMIRDFKDSSGHRTVRDLQPVGRDVGPMVTVEMTTGPYRLTYTKRWLKSPFTELHISAPEVLESLEVTQGSSLDQAQLAGIQSLQQALEEDGTENPQSDDLLVRIQERYDSFFTRSGQMRADKRRLVERPQELRREVEELETASAELDRLTEKFEALTLEKVQLVERATATSHTLIEYQDKLRELEGLEVTRKNCQLTLDNEEGDLAAIKKLLMQRATQEQELAAQKEKQETLGQELESLKQEIAQQQEAVQAADQRVANAKQNFARARGEVREANRKLQSFSNRQELERLTDQLGRAEKLQADLEQARRSVPSSSLTAESLARIEEVAQELKVLKLTFRQAAPQVTVERLGRVPVTIDGDQVTDRTQQPVVEETVIAVGSDAQITIVPGVDAAEGKQQIRDVEEQLAELLAAARVESAVEAARSFREAESSKQVIAQLSATLESLLAGETLMTLRQSHEEMRRLVAETSSESEPGTLPGAAKSRLDLETALAEATAAEADAEIASNHCEEEQATLNRKLVEINSAATTVQVRLETLDETVKDLAAQLESDREETPTEDLESRLTKQQVTVELAKQNLAEATSALEAGDYAGTVMLQENAQKVYSRARKELADLETQILQTKTLVDDRSARGFYDELTAARSELSAAERQAEQLQHESLVAQLLWETFTKHQQRTQAAYVEPYRQQVQQLGRPLFGPDFAVKINTDLQIESRTLRGETIPFAALSGGAKEQLSLLGRLACAQLVDPAGGAPLIMDDTLGFTDPRRLESIGAVLSNVGDGAQIIILTCQPDRFGHVGNAEVIRMN